MSTPQQSGKPYAVRCYRCLVADCPVRSQYTRAKQGRLIERVWAEIKQTAGFRRFTWRSLAGAQGQWALVTLVFNLRKLWALWRTGQFRWPTMLATA